MRPSWAQPQPNPKSRRKRPRRNTPPLCTRPQTAVPGGPTVHGATALPPGQGLPRHEPSTADRIPFLRVLLDAHDVARRTGHAPNSRSLSRNLRSQAPSQPPPLRLPVEIPVHCSPSARTTPTPPAPSIPNPLERRPTPYEVPHMCMMPTVNRGLQALHFEHPSIQMSSNSSSMPEGGQVGQ